jgi:DHA1 family multidrug resistance protein-like MFS transporter
MHRWRRTFWAIWFANLIAGVAMMSILPFFPGHLEALGVVERGEVAAWTGLIYGAAPLSAALASPLWGALGDRYGRRLMVLRSMAALFLFVGAMAFATTPWQLLALRVVQGAFSGFFAPSMTLVSAVAPPHQQGRVAGAMQAALVLGAIGGPVLGEAVRASSSAGAVYLVVAALAALAGFLVVACVDADRPAAREPAAGTRRGALRRSLAESVADLGELRAKRDLRGAVALLFWIQFGVGATNPQLELFVRDLPARWLTVSAAAPFSVLALANLLALEPWGAAGDRHGSRRVLAWCALASGLALLAHALVPSYELLLGSRVLLGIATAGAGPLAFGVAAAETSSDRRGAAIGIVFSARALAVALSAGIGGWLSVWIGIRGLFVLGGGVVLLSLAAHRFGIRRWHALRGSGSGAAGADARRGA